MELLQAANASKKQAFQELNEALEKVIQLEESVYEAKIVQKEVLLQLKKNEDVLEDALNEAASFKEINSKIKNMIYTPARGDPVDNALSNFICEYPEKEKLKLMFLRETEGVYQFGSKKVLIKVERGHQIKIRVGGGFMDINDFLETYTQSEYEKVKKKDPLTRFHSKLALQKYTSEQA